MDKVLNEKQIREHAPPADVNGEELSSLEGSNGESKKNDQQDHPYAKRIDAEAAAEQEKPIEWAARGPLLLAFEREHED
jgi:hypothetical protein